MDRELFFQIMGLIVATGSVVVAVIALWHSLKSKRQKSQKEVIAEYGRHETRMKTLELDMATAQRDTQILRKDVEEIRKERGQDMEQIRKDQNHIATTFMEEIKDLRKLHDKDISVVHAEIKDLVKEFTTNNDEDHGELKQILAEMNGRLIKVCTQFEDHKESLRDKPSTVTRRKKS